MYFSWMFLACVFFSSFLFFLLVNSRRFSFFAFFFSFCCLFFSLFVIRSPINAVLMYVDPFDSNGVIQLCVSMIVIGIVVLFTLLNSFAFVFHVLSVIICEYDHINSKHLIFPLPTSLINVNNNCRISFLIS